MKKKRLEFGFFAMLIAFSVIPLIISIAIVCSTSIYTMKQNMESKEKETLYIAAKNLANHCKENNINYATSANYNDYLDSLKEQQIEMAIILNDAPCVASIKNVSGFRIREIPFDKDVVADREELLNGYYKDDVLIDSQTYYAYYMPIETNGEIIGMAFAGALTENVTGPINRIVMTFVMLAVILLVLFALLSLFISRKFSKSFSFVSENVNRLSDGSLAKQSKYVSMVKEINSLLHATASMQSNLSGIIGKVKEVSEDLIEQVKTVTTLSESSSTSAGQITMAVKDLSLSTESMTENVQDINNQMLEIAACINEISESVKQLSDSSEAILLTNNEAQTNMHIILKNSEKSVNAVREITEQIKVTNASIQEIDEVVQLILTISEQSDLLSLNASIEAARAGDQGKGFMVVAEEIRKLSGQSAQGAEVIRNLAQVIIEKSKHSVELSEAVQQLILSEQESVSNTQEKYEKLSSEIILSAEEIRTIAQRTEHLSAYKEKVVQNVQDLSAISEENAAGNEQVGGNITDILSEIQTVSESSVKMNEMARELETAVAYFHE